MKPLCLIPYLYTLLTLAYFVVPIVPTFAQSGSIKHYTTQDGLPGNITYKVTQDDDGYMWIPTDNGICRFDGVEFKTYNSPLIKNNEILDCKMIWGQLWFASFGGRLFYIDQEEIYQFNPEGILEDEYVSDWQEDAFGNLFVITNSGLVIKAKEKEGEHGHRFSIEAYQVKPYFTPRISKYRERLFVLSGRHGYEYNPVQNTFQKVSPLGANVSFYIKSQLGGKDVFTHWPNSEERYLTYYKQNTWQTQKLPDHPYLKAMVRFYEDSQARIWVYGADHLTLFDTSFQFVKNLTAYINQQKVNLIFEDREKNIWLSTNGSGLYVVQNSSFLHYNSHNSSLNNDYIYDIAGDEESYVFIGSHLGWLTVMQKHQLLQSIRISNSAAELYDVFVRNNNTVYVSLDGMKILKYKTPIIKRTTSPLEIVKMLASTDEGLFGNKGFSVMPNEEFFIAGGGDLRNNP